MPPSLRSVAFVLLTLFAFFLFSLQYAYFTNDGVDAPPPPAPHVPSFNGPEPSFPPRPSQLLLLPSPPPSQLGSQQTFAEWLHVHVAPTAGTPFLIFGTAKSASERYEERNSATARYARRHGYGYVQCYTDTLAEAFSSLNLDPHGHHWKSACAILILSTLPLDPQLWLLFHDDDAFINPFAYHVPLNLYTQGVDHDVHWIWDDHADTNTGAWFVRNSMEGRILLHEWLGRSMSRTFTWSDQHTFRGLVLDAIMRKQRRPVTHVYDSCSRPQSKTSDLGTWDYGKCDKLFEAEMKRLGLTFPYENAGRKAHPFLFLPRSIVPRFHPAYRNRAIDKLMNETFIIHPSGLKGRMSQEHVELFLSHV